MRSDVARGGIVQRLLRGTGKLLLVLTLAACGGGGGGGVDIDDEAQPPAAPGGNGTGADGVPIFWKVLGYNQGYGRANAVVENADGSFVVAGFQANSTGMNGVFLAKTSSNGTAAWEKRLASTDGAIAYALRAVPTGGYMVAGAIGSGAAGRGFLLKVDADGNPLAGWPKTFGSSAGQFFAMLPVNGGADGFVLAGVNASKLYVVRVAADGSVPWAKNDYGEFCGGGGSGAAAAIVPTRDGRYVLAGRTGCNQWAGFLMKIEPANGSEVWRRIFDDSDATQYAALDALVETADGSLLATGRVGPNCDPGSGDARCEMLVVKTDGSGAQLWRHRYGGAEMDSGAAVAIAADGSFLVVGSTRSYSGTIDDRTVAFMWDELYLIKVASDGATQWQKVKGVAPRAVDEGMAVLPAADGGFVIAGESGGNPLLVKFDKTGATVNLGPGKELSVNVPATTGLIGFGNAVEVAGGGASALLLPPQVGGQLLERLIAASQGASPAAYCDGGGNYAFAPAVPPNLATGGSWTLTFDKCVRGGGGDPIALDGTVSLTLSGVSGTPGASTYSATLTATAITLTIDEPGTSPLLRQTLTGSLVIGRTVAAGAIADQVGNMPGRTLAVSESSGGTVTASATIGPFSIRTATPLSGALRAATAGDSATLVVAGQTFTVSVPQAIELDRTTQEPTGGVYGVSASDNSRLTATLVAPSGSMPASATLAIDTDGDGIDDGRWSVGWDFIY